MAKFAGITARSDPAVGDPAVVYRLRIMVAGISPLIWRRLLVSVLSGSLPARTWPAGLLKMAMRELERLVSATRSTVPRPRGEVDVTGPGPR